jgi:hypothetical protein
MPGKRQQFVHNGEAAQLHEPNAHQAVVYNRQAVNVAANKVSVASFLPSISFFHRSLNMLGLFSAALHFLRTRFAGSEQVPESGEEAETR